MAPLKAYEVFLEWDDESSVWVTYVPELGDISTFGATEEVALAMTKELIQGHLEAFAEENEPVESAHPTHLHRLVELPA